MTKKIAIYIFLLGLIYLNGIGIRVDDCTGSFEIMF